jgi:YfiH family protein
MPAPLEADNLRNLRGIRHGFFTRDGGVSGGVYASLNCGIGSNDASELVLENRRSVGQHLGGRTDLFGDGVVTLYQEHGTTAREVSGPPSRDALPHADAIVSVTPGLVVGVLTADCAPVLLADPEARVVAAAHAGWRGALAGIIESAVLEMERHGARRQRISAAVGPCINQEAYEVGPEFEREFLSREIAYGRFFNSGGPALRAHFDLPGFVYQRLSDSGVGNIQSLSPCTCENESLFFSYRRKTRRNEPDYGRQISAIVVA